MDGNDDGVSGGFMDLGVAQLSPKIGRCIICSEFVLAATGNSAAAPLSAFIIPQISGEDSWMFDRCSAR